MTANNFSRGAAAKISVLAVGAGVLALLGGCPAQEGPHPPPHLERTTTPAGLAAPASPVSSADQSISQMKHEPAGGHE
jgi:hypothetical protein